MVKEYASRRQRLAARKPRGNADPVDIDDSPLNLDFGPRGDYENLMEPKPPIEATGAGAKS